MAPGVNSLDWRALVAVAVENSIISFQPGNLGYICCNVDVMVRDGVQLVAAMPSEPVIVDCQGSGGRHFSVAEGARFVLEGLTFAKGASGLRASKSWWKLEIRNSRLVNCNAIANDCGVCIEVGGTFSAFNSTLENCASSEGHCGAICGIASSIVLTGGSYSGNDAWQSGGLAYAEESSLTMAQVDRRKEEDAYSQFERA